MTRDELLTFLSPLPDDAILGLTLYGEARGEPIEGIIAVGCVIRNRVRDSKKRWGQTFRAACLQKKQFSCWNVPGDANHERVIEAAAGLLGNAKASAALEECAWVALGISRGALRDSVKGANHYHVATMTPRPTWAQSHVPLVQKGAHVYYKM